MTSFLFGGQQQKQSKVKPNNSGLRAQTAVAGLPVPIVWGQARLSANMIWFGDYKAVKHKAKGGAKGGGGSGGGKGGGSATYTYSASFYFVISEGPIAAVLSVWDNETKMTLKSSGFTASLGSYDQPVWSYLATKHAGQALAYRGLSAVYVANYDMGSNAQIPNFNYEILSVINGALPGLPDADPRDCLLDYLNNPMYGLLGFPAGAVGDLQIFSDYCIATGMVISDAQTTQRPGSDYFSDIFQGLNCEIVWNGSVLTVVPYGDTAITGNGRTFTPPSQPLVSLGDDDFASMPAAVGGASAQNGPVTCTRSRQADTWNVIQVEYLDRTNAYNPTVVLASNDGDIDSFGARINDVMSWHFFANAASAQMSCNLQLGRQAIRNTYVFNLDERFVFLDPMDVIAISDPVLGLVNQWVRIKEIQENGDGSFTFTCEEYLQGTGASPLFGQEFNAGYLPDMNVDPGPTNVPIVFEPNLQISGNSPLVWMMASGSQTDVWGGCQVWISSANDTYTFAGEIKGPDRQGLLTTSLPVGPDPDLIDVLSVDMSMSGTELGSGTQADADEGVTLCYVDGELLSFETATLTDTEKYNLTYLRRGLYGTQQSVHVAGAQFGRVDDDHFSYVYNTDLLGKTIYIKLLSYNIFGGGLQTIDVVEPIMYTIKGPPPPIVPQNFSAQQKGAVVAFTWDAVVDFALKGYDVGYAPQGTSTWEEFLLLSETAAGTEMTNASVPPGNWTFAIKAKDLMGQLSLDMATSDLQVTNENAVIYSQPEEPAFGGDTVGFVRHFTGKLVPMGTKNSNLYVQVATPATPTTSSVAGGTIAATTYWVRNTYVDQAGDETNASVEVSKAVGTNNLLIVIAPASSTGAVGWNTYVSTATGTEKKQNAAPIAIGTNWTEPTTGLVAGAAYPTVNKTGWDVFDMFVPDPVSSASYTTQVIDTSYDSVNRIYATIDAEPGPGQSIITPAIALSVDTWKDGESDPNVYDPWTVGSVDMRYLKARITYTSILEGSTYYIDDFNPVVDTIPATVRANGLTVAPGGSHVDFDIPFHNPPYVNVTAISGSAVYANASNVTGTGCTINVWNSSDVSVGGLINYAATGE